MQTKDKTIIICSIVRDAEYGLRNNIPIIQALCEKFKDYHIVVYENDSRDHTKTLLQEWHDLCPEKIHVLINDTDPTKTIPTENMVDGANPFFSRNRIEKMASLRNKYMEYVEVQNWKADFLMVVDLDVSQLYLEPILTSFAREDWDAVTAFGYSTSPKFKRRYHDSYALMEYGEEQNAKSESNITMLAEKYGKLKPDDSWIRVDSAFGGVAIYRFDAVKNMRYQVLDNEDPRVEVKCEHYSIYKQMKERGFDRFYINPGMCLLYQRVTWSIIKATLKRKLHIS